MGPKNIKKSQVDSEQLLTLRKFRARCRFKALVRNVISNLVWLKGTSDNEVKERIKELLQSEDKHHLTTRDKALMNKTASLRTDDEKNYLYRKIGHYKIFRKYPDVAKYQLASVAYYKVFPYGRVILRRNHRPQAMYYILSGEVRNLREETESITGDGKRVELRTHVAGDVFGEYSLLYDRLRVSTFVSSTDVELLVIEGEDFCKIIKNTVAEKWETIKMYMKRFSYFQSYDESTLKEGSILAKLKKFKPNEIIISNEDKYASRHVYFLVEGKCQMIEHFDIVINKIYNKEYYSLAPVKNVKWKEQIESEVFENTEPFNNLDEKSTSISITTLNSERKKLPTTPISSILSSSRINKSYSDLTYSKQRMKERIFMEVCTMNPGATFGFENTMKNRKIVALTECVILLLPTFWLLERNTANIWRRIQHYFTKVLPTTNELFKTFVSERKWQQYRDNVVRQIVARSSLLNPTTIHDIPISVRINGPLRF